MHEIESVRTYECDDEDHVPASMSNREGYTVYTEPLDTPLGENCLRYVLLKETGEAHESYNLRGAENKEKLDLFYAIHKEAQEQKNVRFVVSNCWSGYSEYTITSTWDEIEFSIGSHSYHFESMPEFFKAMSEVPKED